MIVANDRKEMRKREREIWTVVTAVTTSLSRFLSLIQGQLRIWKKWLHKNIA